ncbi:hypothetical protein [Limosilactobacillus ingluviei]|uniref:hypothetical protein n=1 Tax=Limosilactobacillus ingluviei TaxID=148604 RepID=UPI0024B8AD8A|nr:hypothetical protein [Limosilactobacillus ingluviei]
MKKGILLALMALSLVLGSSVAAQAAELTSSVPAGRNINDHVTSLTIQSAQLQDGQIQSGADLSVQGLQPIRAGVSRRRGGWRPANRSHGCGAADRQRGA